MASRGETNKPLDIFFLGLLLAQGFRFGNGQEIRMQVPRQTLAEILSTEGRRPQVVGQPVSEILALPAHPQLRTGREVVAARLGLQLATDLRRPRNAIQFEGEVPENPWEGKEGPLEPNQGARLIAKPFSVKNQEYARTAYQETAPSLLDQAGLLDSRDRVFAILSPVARGVAMQEVAKRLASMATRSPPTLPPATVEQLEAWKRLQEEESRAEEEEMRRSEQEMQEQHLLWQQQRMQDLQDNWRGHTSSEVETSLFDTMVDEPFMSEEQDDDEDARRREEEEEVERLQSELHAQLLAQIPPGALASLAPQLDGLGGEIKQAQIYNKARLAQEETREQTSSPPSTENIWSFKFSELPN